MRNKTNRTNRPSRPGNSRNSDRPRNTERSGSTAISGRTRMPDGNLVIGRNSVREVVRHDPKRVIKIYGSEKDTLDKYFTAADQKIIRENKIPFEYLHKDEITLISKSDSHQSLIAVTKRKAEIGIKDYLKLHTEEESLVLMLDDIQDPQNLGAILRAAECFAVDLVIYSKNKGAGITPAVTKASVGASELLNIVSVSNLADAIGKFKDAGYWAILADADAESGSLKAFEFPKKTLLIMGSEGYGAQPLIKKEVDFKLFIDLHGRISSLNVSQATAIMLDSYRRQFSKVKA